jgi:hypothetical protein
MNSANAYLDIITRYTGLDLNNEENVDTYLNLKIV